MPTTPTNLNHGAQISFQRLSDLSGIVTAALASWRIDKVREEHTRAATRGVVGESAAEVRAMRQELGAPDPVR